MEEIRECDSPVVLTKKEYQRLEADHEILEILCATILEDAELETRDSDKLNVTTGLYNKCLGNLVKIARPESYKFKVSYLQRKKDDNR